MFTDLQDIISFLITLNVDGLLVGVFSYVVLSSPFEIGFGRIHADRKALTKLVIVIGLIHGIATVFLTIYFKQDSSGAIGVFAAISTILLIFITVLLWIIKDIPAMLTGSFAGFSAIRNLISLLAFIFFITAILCVPSFIIGLLTGLVRYIIF